MRHKRVTVDPQTHGELIDLAAATGLDPSEVVALAVQRLGQERVGAELSRGLRADETEWLDADLGDAT